MRAAVVGHVEWVEFARVERVPAAGEIVHASELWEEAAGGGAVAARELARLGADVTFITSLGGDALGAGARAQLEAAGIHVIATPTSEPQRRALTFVDDDGERTITVLGNKLLPSGEDGEIPWEEVAQADAVYFVSGDAAALRQARRGRVLVATVRELPTLRLGGVELDALVGSGKDEGERYHPGDLEPAPRLVVTTSGPLGGWAQPGGPFLAADPPAEILDAYGAGDCFAAGLTYALADGLAVEEALAFAARSGAAALGRRGAGTAG